jgi:hypothetical protein
MISPMSFRDSAISANVQMLTIRRLFLTALSRRARESESMRGIDLAPFDRSIPFVCQLDLMGEEEGI